VNYRENEEEEASDENFADPIEMWHNINRNAHISNQTIKQQ
jgi:hypothetical protein